MPNHVTNKIKAPSHVIAALVNEKGNVDFGRVIAFTGEFPWDGVNMAAENLAEVVTGKPLSDHPLLASLEAANRAETKVQNLSDESFEQFVQMLRNFRKCGVFHGMAFARQQWGTKWNAYECVVDVAAGTAQFDTAWSCPEPVLTKLSSQFPDDQIEVTFADEDIGSNCGTFTLKAGSVISSDIAPSWRDMTDEQKAKWRAFACDVKGWNPSDDED
ncbi:hypothetical protein [Caballeronia sp. AZ7_KS35]|uniref:DUF1281 family ferredoxin-like fold protein n=1 Tax=Caballeronia sp. AZ7_KS35 TaxID=2921762 RepID=UPI002027B21E|nr:hypothetical protein [Caballeronia sp. AZ7_KS35]